MFQCEITLPEESPIRSVIGRPYSRKSIAKRAAAFDACLMLRKHKHLDNNLMSTKAKQRHVKRNAQLALTSKSANHYSRRLKPDVWACSRRDGIPSRLYITVFKLTQPEAMRRPVQPIALLTRTPMPDFPSFPLHLEQGATSDVQFKSYSDAIQLTEESLASLTTFTIKVFHEVFAKEYNNNQEEMSYWLAPILSNWEDIQLDGPLTRLIDWEALFYAHENKTSRWESGIPKESLVNKFLVDPNSGARRFFTTGLSSKSNSDLANPRWPHPPRAQDGQPLTIGDYSNKKWRATRDKSKFDQTQPVLEASWLSTRRDFLSYEMTKQEEEFSGYSDVLVSPQFFDISTLPPAAVVMCSLVASVMHRLESYLIALELCAKLDLVITPELALEAITKDSDNSEEHRAEQIQFQRGMGRNYERLEFMGDCFLKTATSIFIFSKFPDEDEYDFHVRRMVMVCNQNLFDQARNKWNIPEYVRSHAFSR